METKRSTSLLFFWLLACLLIPRSRVGSDIRPAQGKRRKARWIGRIRPLCALPGQCPDVTQSELFVPEVYESIAVIVADGTRRFRQAGAQGLVRDRFESALLDRGYTLSAAASVDSVYATMGRSRNAPSDSDLRSLTEFVEGSTPCWS